MPTHATRKKLLEALKSKLKKKLAAKLQRMRQTRRKAPVAPKVPVPPIVSKARTIPKAPIPTVAASHHTPVMPSLPTGSPKRHSARSVRRSISLERTMPLTVMPSQSLRASVKQLATGNADLEVKSTRQQSQHKKHSVGVMASNMY